MNNQPIHLKISVHMHKNEEELVSFTWFTGFTGLAILLFSLGTPFKRIWCTISAVGHTVLLSISQIVVIFLHIVYLSFICQLFRCLGED